MNNDRYRRYRARKLKGWVEVMVWGLGIGIVVALIGKILEWLGAL